MQATPNLFHVNQHFKDVGINQQFQIIYGKRRPEAHGPQWLTWVSYKKLNSEL